MSVPPTATESTATGWIGLTLESLDTLFFRDGRPFEATNRVQSGLPSPQTLAGAVRTALLARTGFNFRGLCLGDAERIEDKLLQAGAQRWIVEAEFRGPFLALCDDDGNVEPLLACPTVLARSRVSGVWSWALPLSPDQWAAQGFGEWRDPDGLWPLNRAVQPDTKAERALVSLSGIRKFLAGSAPDDGDCHPTASLFGHDHRVGIAINPDSLTTAEGQLYAIGLLALQPRVRRGTTDSRRVCLYCEIRPGAGLSDGVQQLLERQTLAFGGEGRQVVTRVVQAVSWPEYDGTRRSSLWYLASPTFLPRRSSGRPLPAFENLRGAASGLGQAVSGWDVLRNGPRATRFAVPAGAVYFVEGPGADSDLLDAGLTDSRNLRREGWGFALQGSWDLTSGK